MPRKLKILIADDHAIVRDGLLAILSLQKDMEVVGEASNGEEAVSLVLQHKPDVIIMDLRMPRKSGAEAIAEIKAAHPETKALILTSYGDSTDLVRAMENGADGALEKSLPKEELLGAIRHVTTGKKFISENIRQQLTALESTPTLSERQLEILDYLARGFDNKEIALSCGLSRSGVKFHLATVYRILDVANRSEAVALALKRHLLNP